MITIHKSLFNKKNLFLSAIYTVILSVITISVYALYSDTVWFSIKSRESLILTLLFYLTSLLFLLFSKCILHENSLKRSLSLRYIILFHSIEALVITIIYLLFTAVIYIERPITHILGLFLDSFVYIYALLVMIYSTHYLSQLSRINRETIESEKLEERSEGDSHLINIKDNNEKIKLSLLSDHILYIVSEDNYIKIFYEENMGVTSRMIRVPTKRIEEELQEYNIIRCHRSYMINIKRVMFFNNDRNNMYLLLNNREINPIPVSRTYRRFIESALSQREKNG